MIDLEGIRAPADAPEPGACVRLERPEPGLARLVLDPPHRPKIAVLDVPLLRDLDRAVGELEQERELRGLVITGREPLSFAAGADVEAIAGVEDPEVAARLARSVQALFQRIHRLGRDGGGRARTVAAVGGPVPGGACELALACDCIVLAEHPKSRIGLPEVLLGIFPAWGGTTRLPRRIGVPGALAAILAGKLYPAKPALRLGLVDRLAKPELLLRVAEDVAAGRAPCPRRRRPALLHWLVDRNFLAGALVAAKARRDVLARTKGHYPAPLVALPLIVRAPRIPLEDGLRNEAEAVRELATSRVTKNLIDVFRWSEEARRLGQGEGGVAAKRFTRAAVVGGGVMGAAIASLLSEKGIATRLRDVERAPLDAALHAHRTELEKQRRKRRIERHEASAAIDRLEVTTEARGFARCELAIEAVAERLEVKRAVFAELASLLPATAVLATNTSSLSVGELAAGLPRPERVVGLHFFNPVRSMPLVEIVRGPRTSDETVARIARLAVDLGKTPVVTRDVAGFLVNRVLGPYLDEAIRLVEAGVEPEAIDEALVGFGMPMGPLELVDEVGLDIASHAGASLAAAYGARMQTSGYLRPLVEGGQLGKKSGAGLYLWSKDAGGRPRKQGKNPRAPAPRGSGGLSRPQIVDRLVLALVNEAARALDEAVVAGPRELDLAMVFGTGFAPFRGGVLRYADERGLEDVVYALKEIGQRLQDEPERAGRFTPAEGLARRAAERARFHG